MDMMRADERQICAKAQADRIGETTVAGKRDRETVVRGVVTNIGIDSFIDDLSSVHSKGLPYQDCEVPMIQTVQKTIDVPQLQFLNKVDDTLVALQRQTSMVQKIQELPQMHVVEKTVEGPQLQIVEQTVETPDDPVNPNL